VAGQVTSSSASRRAWIVARVALFVCLSWFYVQAATEHARVVNVSRARADQSSYLWDAVAVFGNWHGQQPPELVGERNRMPLYPAFLALFYDPSLSPDEFFEVGKRWNIRLSLVLLALLWAIFAWHLPPLVSTNLTLVVAFGYFVFKAGYVQAELLYYSLLFAAFLACCNLLKRRDRAPSLILGVLAGVLAGLAHLTKAAVLPLVVIFLAVYGVRELACLVRGDRPSRVAWRAVAGVAFVACFLGVLYPYISTSKRVFGHYFYNVNTTFYVWYDDWPDASVGTYQHGDGVGWPDMPPDQIPSMAKYWRTHSMGQMLSRVGGGFVEMAVVSYERFWYLQFFVLYAGFALILIATCWRPFCAMIRSNAAVAAFVLLSAVTYLVAVAFYQPISGSTTRMLLALATPLLFVLSYFFARAPFDQAHWRVAGVTVTPAHFHLLVFATMGLDLAFVLPTRLLADFTGY